MSVNGEAGNPHTGLEIGRTLRLAREVTEARGDCTQEKLKAGDEACGGAGHGLWVVGAPGLGVCAIAPRACSKSKSRMCFCTCANDAPSAC